MLHRFLLFAPLLAASISAWGVAAKPGIVEYMQPDGSVVDILIHGDENFHYVTSPDGVYLQINDQGIYERKENFDIKSLIAGASHKRMKRVKSLQTRSGEAKYRYSTSAFPTTGNPHSLVILVEYPDCRFSLSDPYDYFEDFLNGEDFTQYKGTGSCRQFYTDNSAGQFSPTFDLYGPILLKNPRVYYGGGQDDDNAAQMVVEAIEALDPSVDFSVYDHNDDGYVDSVYLIYAGKGENAGGPPESVWPYSWELVEEGIHLEADGVIFNTYGVSNELQSDNEPEGIGTFTHEFGHVLGLPDLYNTLSSDSSTPRMWSVMDNGSYNNDSRTPPNFSAFERYSLGWIVPSEFYTAGEYRIENLADSNSAFIIPSEENPDEFFMVENRQQKGWDKFLPHHGMLVWHIDFDQNQWDNNTVNNRTNHQHLDLLRADNDRKTSTFSGDPFPGSMGVTQIGNSTSPALKTWLNRDLNVTSLYDIEESDGVVRFIAEVTQERQPAGIVLPETEDIDIKVVDGMLSVDRGSHPVYSLSGILSGTVSPDSPLSLPKGVYLVAKKKVVI